MFCLAIILMIVTYIPIFIGSCIAFTFVAWISEGQGVVNTFASPNSVYKFYRTTFEGWKNGIREWYKRESA